MQTPVLVNVPSFFRNGFNALFLIMAVSLVSPSIYASEQPGVFVSVLPQKFFVERIGGDQVHVDVMVKPGFSPATYEPSPRQISSLAKAGLYFRIGVPFEQAWMKRIQGVNPEMLVVDNRDGIDLLEIEHHDHDHGHGDHAKSEDDHHDGHADDGHDDHAKSEDDHHDGHADDGHEMDGSLDPHIWTSPQVAIVMATQIKDQLVKLLPARESVFTKNHANLVEELRILDKELQDLFAESAEHKFMVFHPSWGYFAKAYGLTQIAIETDGKEPGARALSALIKQAKQEKVKTIFVQPQFDERAAKQVARSIDGRVVAIDPLAEDYIENLRKAAGLIAGVVDE